MKQSLKFFLYIAVLVSLPLTVGFARANGHAGIGGNKGFVLRLAAESWLAAQSSEVSLALSLAPEQFEDPQAVLRKSLTDIDSTTDWHIVSFHQPKDQTGLSRWQVTARARLAVDRLAALPGMIDKLAKPGLQLRLQNVSHHASLAEEEMLKSQLRDEIYRKARDERDRVNALNLGDKVTIKQILFDHVWQEMRGPQMAHMAMAESAPRHKTLMADSASNGRGGSSGLFPISRKYHLTAILVLAPVENAQ